MDASTFDPMAVATDWLDAYRATSSTIVDMYTDEASLECGCCGRQILVGRKAIAEYWRRRFIEKPAGELVDLQQEGSAIVVSYRVPDGVVRAVLHFSDTGKIASSNCGPLSKVIRLRR